MSSCAKCNSSPAPSGRREDRALPQRPSALAFRWDGFHNNYFIYHDVHGTGKWTMYPWDQDKTWGYHDGIRGYEVFFDMPLTFGMAGDAPPGWPKNRRPPPVFGGGPIWWRPGGHFSMPLLANPQFRKLFLAKTKELLEREHLTKRRQYLLDQDEIKKAGKFDRSATPKSSWWQEI